MHFSELAVSPKYIIVLIICIGFLIFFRTDKGVTVFLIKIYSLLHVIIYLVALYLYLTT